MKAQVLERIAQGDTKFSDSLELMTFLANLIGSEHIERFIPLADADNERELEQPRRAEAAQRSRHTPSPPRAPEPATAPPSIRTRAARRQSVARGTGCEPHRHDERHARDAEVRGREAARRTSPVPAAARRTARPPRGRCRNSPPRSAARRRRSSTPQITRTERRAPEHAPAARAAGKQPARITPPPQADTAREQVIADAARLVQWGRKWYELAELIARMADRPPLPEVRRILKDNKTAIEKKAGGG